MKKTSICIAAAILLLSFAGCGKSGGTEIPFTGQEENNVTQQTEPEGDDIAGPTEAELENTKQKESGSQVQEEVTSDNEAGNDKEEPMKISVKSADYEIVYELNDSHAAEELCAQLPLTTDVEPFSNNEITFYPPEKLDTANTPLSGGEAGSLSYYSPWGDVVMFYAPCTPNGSLYEIGTVVSGKEYIEKLSGTVEVSICD